MADGASLGDFDRAISHVLHHEGGYVNHPQDRGGPTNWGCTQALVSRLFPGKRVEDLLIEDAKAIYRAHFWNPLHADKMPAAVALVLLDAAVLHGVPHAVRMLQEAVGATVDGILGPKTLDRVFARDPRFVAHELCRVRMDAHVERVRKDPGQVVFLRGWARRVLDAMAEACR